MENEKLEKHCEEEECNEEDWARYVFSMSSLDKRNLDAIMELDPELAWEEMYRGHYEVIVFLLRDEEIVFSTWYNDLTWYIDRWTTKTEFNDILIAVRKRFRYGGRCYYEDGRGRRWRELNRKCEAFCRKTWPNSARWD